MKFTSSSKLSKARKYAVKDDYQWSPKNGRWPKFK